MGGTPVIALNIMMFPASKLPVAAYRDILLGGADTAAKAGVRIIGGHSIDDTPPKYGLAVVGYVHPQKIITNAGARPGDVLILTKPIGIGVILAARRLGLATDDDVEEAKRLMKQLNASGAEVMKKYNIKGATDVTGFGLAGHALKMAKASSVKITLNLGSVPLIGDTYSLVDKGCIPGAAFRNLEFADSDTVFVENLDYNLKMIAFDAQTSGGLLMSVAVGKVNEILKELGNSGLLLSAVVGSVSDFNDQHLCLAK